MPGGQRRNDSVYRWSVDDRNLHGISNLTDNSVAGFKYFDFGKEEQPLAFSVQFRAARNNGKISLYLDAPNDTDGKKIGELSVEATDAGSAFSTLTCTTEPVSGEHALYFVFDINEKISIYVCSISSLFVKL